MRGRRRAFGAVASLAEARDVCTRAKAGRSGRRAPGIRFEAPPPQLDEVLPRMDIAAFIGFAASGPVHLPVAVESAAEFEEIFGGNAPLAWDPQRGETVYGRLAPAVRAFFRNGGTRCWVVRAAEKPSASFFPIPGLVRMSGGSLTPAFARARADGSWSDDLRVGSAVAPVPIDILRVHFTPALEDPAGRGNKPAVLEIEAAVSSPDDLIAGDLLQLEYDGYVVMLAVADVRLVDGSPPSDRPRVQAVGRPTWFQRAQCLPLILGLSSSREGRQPEAVVYTAQREPAGANEIFASEPIPCTAVGTGTGGTADSDSSLELTIDLADAPEPGALVSVNTDASQLWLSVHTVGVVAENASGADRVRVTGPALWWLRQPPDGIPLQVRRAHRLSLELWVRRDDTSLVLRDLGLTPHHSRYWAGLPHDDARYAASEQHSGGASALASERRFPLAGAGPSDAVYIPIDVGLSPDRFLGAARRPTTALERDGLATFSPALFLDPDLITPLSERVLNEAGHVRYTAESPRRLKGIHSTIEIDEATIIAVPDASHRGWMRVVPDTPAPPQPSSNAPPPAWGTFLDCSVQVIARPQWAARFLESSPLRFDSGTYTLEWQGQAGAAYVVEEAHSADWSDATGIYSGSEPRQNLYARPRGTYYYRVRATAGARTSDWSDAIVVTVAGAQAWHVTGEQAYSTDTLLAVHRALLRMAAARGDLFALLTLPEHYRGDDTLAYVKLLKNAGGPVVPVDVGRPIAPLSLPLGVAEERVFSFGGLYHPWLILREQPGAAPLIRVPADGSIAGLFAGLSLRRAAWIAPANEALLGVVATSPPIARTEGPALTDAAVNLIRQEPRGFLSLSANTLSDDPDLALVNVRRLLSLLRRLALREGTTYVFEPHDASFQRLVQRGFEGLLTHMFERGAFAGRNATSAFQVNTSASLNTPASVDQGRFIVELRVAPSVPLSFLTVRLVQSGDRTLVMEER